MKIIDKIKDFRAKGKPFYSFEFFPPKTEAGVYNLYSRLDRMAGLEPAFIDVTWGAGGSSCEATLEISKNAQTYFGLDVMMHLTCTGLSRGQLKDVLKSAQDAGIQNILALRGDPPHGASAWECVDGGLEYAVDLVKFIRDEFGDTFGIAVAGYPEGHTDAPDKDTCIRHLKDKVDAGADFVVTQLFYDLDEYRSFLARAKAAGITCPILPGVLPLQTYDRFKRFAESVQMNIPQRILEAIEPIRSDDAAVQSYGVELGVDMSKELLDMGAPGLHFYTLNLESSITMILRKMGFLDECRVRRELPWRKSTHEGRRDEEIRPIFWSNRPRSYLARTQSWDDFPNGRWGDSRSPTYGSLDEYYLMRRGIGAEAIRTRRRQAWGEPEALEDVGQVFVRFCRGEIQELPWCDVPVQTETGRIESELVRLNQAGYWTINSQPPVSGAPSTDPDTGWGGPGGIVFQKAYVEFFCSRKRMEALIEALAQYPSMTYHAVNAKGESHSNPGDGSGVNAVTWGVFPGREIVQPTVVDPQSFMIWKDEAFQLWKEEWQSLYPQGSRSWELLGAIHDEFFLVNVVENDFIAGDIFRIFDL